MSIVDLYMGHSSMGRVDRGRKLKNIQSRSSTSIEAKSVFEVGLYDRSRWEHVSATSVLFPHPLSSSSN